MSDRAARIDHFLAGQIWQDWSRSPLAGDASARRYIRLANADETVILMDAPPENGEDTQQFVKIAKLLTATGFAAPEILLQDKTNGFLLLGDLGKADFAQHLDRAPYDEATLYRSAADVLLRLETLTPPTDLQRLTPAIGAQMIEMTGTYYSQTNVKDLCAEVEKALLEFAPDPDVLALRDFHAENLIWRADRSGLHQVGLLDFQDAFIAPAGYDLASLLRDARRDVSASVINEIIEYYTGKTKAKGPFRTRLACLGVQRNLRILGVFERLATDMKKTRYRAFMPRVWRDILQDLQDPALATLKQAVLDTLPPPENMSEAGP